MAEKGVDTEKGGKKTWKIQEEDILIRLKASGENTNICNDKKKMAREAISKVIREETGT